MGPLHLNQDPDVPRHVTVGGVRIPALVYGTAWKEERTASLVRAALEAGFRGIDTANQRKHYHEAAVGEAVHGALRAGALARDDLFLQTKFTFVRGQDARLPYDPRATVAEQVEQSCASSLEHLGVERIDAYLLHGPSGPTGLATQDWEAWSAMEGLHRAGKTRLLGVSNVSAAQLEELHDGASVKPSVVQSRTLVWPRADLATRTFCSERGLVYEGFSLLTAAPQLLTHAAVRAAAARTGRTPAEVVLQFWLEEGMVVLSGTTSREHMRQDLSLDRTALLDAERRSIRAVLGA